MRQRVLALFFVLSLAILGQDGPFLAYCADVASPAPSDPTAALKEAEAKKRDTLKYGIESEILDLLGTLKAEKDSSFNPELENLFSSSRGLKLRVAILDFWSGLEWKGGEAVAIGLIEGRDAQDPALVSSALAYLAQIRSKKALVFSKDLIKEGDKKILPGLIKLLGRAGGPAEEDLLVGYLDSDEATEDLKQSAMRALGDFGSAKAADRLMKILEDAQASKTTRMVAAEALGKIGDSRAIKSLVAGANGDDLNVRASSITALGNFKASEAEAAILASLRDTAVQVRIAACKAVGNRKMDEAVPALIYKASYDPEKAVKTEAIKALGEIGGKDGPAFLRSYLETAKNESAMRVLAFGVLLRKDKASIPALVTRFSAEAKEKDRGFYIALAKEMANGEPCPEAAPLARILFSDSDYLMRLGGLEWARRNKALEIRPDLERLSTADPSDYIKKKALEILATFK